VCRPPRGISMGKRPAERYKGAVRFYVLASAVLMPVSAVAQVTVDQMTCAQAQRFVHQNGRIYAKSPAGPLPAYPISSIWTTPSCAGRQMIWPQTYATRDGVQCTVGYTCAASGGGSR
jgi:hypothetical protein